MSKFVIYCAHCLISGKKYIGKTTQDLEERRKQHIYNSKSKNKRYTKIKFCRALHKYGEENFIWGIIEECDSEQLDKREIYWIEHYNTFYEGYNSTLGGEGGVNPNICRSFTLTDSKGNVITDSNVKEFCRKNGLDSGNLCAILSGKRKSYKGYKLPETKFIGSQSTAEKKSKEFTIMSPTGEIITSKNIRKFCRDNDLSRSGIGKVLLGEFKSHRGYKLPETEVIGHEILTKEFTIMSPTGEIITSKNIKKFCLENNLSEGNFHKVLSGKIKSYKGYKLPETKLTGYDILAKEFKLLSPDGEIICGKNVNQFCRDNNLDSSSIGKVLSGKRKHYKGYRLPPEYM